MERKNENFPPYPAVFCQAGKFFNCEASGIARNKLSLLADGDVWKIETDGVGETRIPPDHHVPACDWLIVSDEQQRKGIGIELKGSDFKHAVEQLASTLQYASHKYQIVPKGGIVVIRGKHPQNTLTSKQNVIVKFRKKFDGAYIREKRAGDKVHLNSDFKV